METAACTNAEAYLIPFPPESVSAPLPIPSGTVTVGRDMSSTIRILDDSVSPRHATIVFENGRYHLTDLNSSKGTRVNGQTVQTAFLQHHDKITFGDRAYVFLMRTDPSFPDTQRQAIRASEEIDLRGDLIEPAELMAQMAESAAMQILSPPDAGDHAATPEGTSAHMRLALLYQLSEKLRASQTTDDIFEKALALILQAMPAAQRGAVIIGGKPGEPLTIGALKYSDPNMKGLSIPISRTIVDWVLTERMALVSQNLLDDKRFRDSESIRIHNLNTILVVPLTRNDTVMGMLYLDGNNLLNPFTPNDVAFAAAVAGEIALSMENIRLREELIQNERMAAIGLMMTNLAHNIKNLLMLNQNALDLLGLQLRQIQDEKILKSWTTIKQSFTRINNLAVNMLAYSKDHQVSLLPTPINAIIESHREVFEKSFAGRGIALELRLASENPKWMIDPNQFQRALVNLVVNAADAVKEHPNGKITVSTHIDQDRKLLVVVSDNGKGIAPEMQSRIFDLFYTTKGTSGSGLGLPMVKKFVEQMGGKITLASKPGQGTTVTMYFQ